MKHFVNKCLLTFFFLFFSQNSLSALDNVGIACMFRNFAPYVKEWMEYHIMIGVDHFWLYDDASTDNSKELLQPYVDKGIVELLSWNDHNADWIPRQIRAYQDALKKANGCVTWLAMIDSDEFLFPTKDKSLPECLKKHFDQATGIYANWRNFGTSHIFLKPEEPMLSKLISCSLKFHPRNSVGKSLVRPERVIINTMWSPHFCPLSPGYTWCNGEGGHTVQQVGSELKTDGQNHEGFIRINHYAFRDEKYFREYRLPRDGNPKLILEQYEQYNLLKNKDILEWIKKNYPKQYETIWANPSSTQGR